MSAGKQLWAVIGPTASGKSSLALALAGALGGEILSVDSMQVYRGMDVGTAKPTLEEQGRIRHHLIDVATPEETFTVARFVEMASEVIDRSAVPLVAAGGTPLYYKALFEGLFEGPEADAGVRARLDGMGDEELYRRLGEVDPAAAGRIHVNDHRRLVRALEVFELTGTPISELQRQWDLGNVRHEARWIGLAWEKEELNRRINARVKVMLGAGWLEEVEGLLKTYPAWSKTAAEATGYRQLIAVAGGKMKLEDAAEEIKMETRQLARRQMKWLKRFSGVKWIAGGLEGGELLRMAMEEKGKL